MMHLVLLFAFGAGASFALFYAVPRVRGWFRDSETLLFARLQMLAGVVLTVLVQVDLSPIVPPEWLTIWLVVSGVATELLRRARAGDLP